jgi:hypothetical protein
MNDKVILQGSVNHFGPRTTETDNAADPSSDGLIRKLVQPLVTIAGTASLIVAADSNDTVNKIPANSLIKRAYLYVEDAFAATTAVSITAGVTGNADALILAAGVGAKAQLTDLSWNEADGDGIGIEVGTSDVEIIAAWNAADATAVGNAVLVVEYMPPLTAYLGDKT